MKNYLESKGISLEVLQKIRNDLWQESEQLVYAKGHDYNYKEQLAGDTLANLRSSSKLGILDSPDQYCLALIVNKINRINSLRFTEPAVKGESMKDAVVDAINYLTYVYAFYLERNAKLPDI